MARASSWQAIAALGATLLCALAGCDSVLGIEEPTARPNDAGAAGSPPAGAGGSAVSVGGEGGVGSGGQESGGAAGAAGAPEAGEAGEAGQAGAGGTPPLGCVPREVRCGGEAELTPELCDDTGTWVVNPDEGGGPCEGLCDAGRCVECAGEQTRCTPCEEGDANCNPQRPQRCVNGAWVAESTCAHYCDAGECQTPASCNGEGQRTRCNDESCCRSLQLPGGRVNRDFDDIVYTDAGFPAEVGRVFLDKYEVTVGRLRSFVEGYPPLLSNGSGAGPRLNGDVGWNGAYPLPADRAALVEALKCNENSTWSDEVGTNDGLPATCVNFYVAYAFCIWDGGRLPTNAEWYFAAAGGAEQRLYAWGDELQPRYASYGALGGLPPKVGSTPDGNGRWGHADLTGSVSEWALDFFQDTYSPVFCDNCVNLTASGERMLKGSSFLDDVGVTAVAERRSESANLRAEFVGFRCARDFK